MSTDYRLLEKILARDLFDGRFAKVGISEHATEGTTETSRCLTDGRNHLCVYTDEDNVVVAYMTRYGANAPGKIPNALAEAFEVNIVGGFETQEEWDAWQAKVSAQKADEEFYVQVLKYIQGEPSELTPGSVGMRKAETAKRLVKTEPSLLLPENKDKLLKEIESIHLMMIVLTPEARALANMIATHEDDLPKA